MNAAKIVRPAIVRPAIVRPVILAAVLLALAACAADKPPPKVRPISFASLPEIRLDVAELQIIPAFTQTRRLPQVEHLFPTAPQDAVAQWAREKIKAVGSSRRAMLVIRRAGVVEIPLKTKKGVRGALTKEPSERYEGELEIELEIRDDSGKRIGWMTTRTERSRSVQEGITEPERMVFWQKLTARLVADLAAAFDKRVTAHLAQYRR